MLSVNYAECRKQAYYEEFYYAECRYAECRYAECRYAECLGAWETPNFFQQITNIYLTNTATCFNRTAWLALLYLAYKHKSYLCQSPFRCYTLG